MSASNTNSKPTITNNKEPNDIRIGMNIELEMLLDTVILYSKKKLIKVCIFQK